MSKVHKSLMIVTLFFLSGFAGCTSNDESNDDSANDSTNVPLLSKYGLMFSPANYDFEVLPSRGEKKRPWVRVKC